MKIVFKMLWTFIEGTAMKSHRTCTHKIHKYFQCLKSNDSPHDKTAHHLTRLYVSA